MFVKGAYIRSLIGLDRAGGILKELLHRSLELNLSFLCFSGTFILEFTLYEANAESKFVSDL